MLKISDFYLDKQKSFIPKKNWSVPCTMDSSFFSQKMPYYLLTLLVYMALAIYSTDLARLVLLCQNLIRLNQVVDLKLSKINQFHIRFWEKALRYDSLTVKNENYKSNHDLTLNKFSYFFKDHFKGSTKKIWYR